MKQNVASTKMTFAENITVTLWRRLIMPSIEFIGGKKFPSGKVTERSYGELPNEKLDVISTAGNSKHKIAVVHIHGGGWICGSKGNFYSKPLLKFSNAGYPVFSLNYPLAPDRPHPFMLRSLLKALAWIKKNHPEFESIHLIGDSAGGNLAMMLGLALTNPKLLSQIDNIDSNLLPAIRSIVNIYGVNDRFTWIEDGFPSAKTFLKSYGGEKAFDKNYISPIPVTPMDISRLDNLPPTFIVGGGEDKLLRSSKIYAEHLRKNFDNVEFKIYDGANHGFFSFGKGCDELSDDMLDFFIKHN